MLQIFIIPILSLFIPNVSNLGRLVWTFHMYSFHTCLIDLSLNYFERFNLISKL